MRPLIRRTRRLLPPLLTLTTTAALAAGAAMVSTTATTATTPSPSGTTVTSAATRLVSREHPTNAGAIFGWGHSHWDDEFTEPGGRVRPTWDVNKPKQVSLQHGQLTLNTGTRGNVVVTAKDQSATTGRWEARVRSKQYTAGGAQYEVNWELVPVDGVGFHCGAQNIAMASYHPGDGRVRGSVRTLPDRMYRYHLGLNLGSDVYHTYAVEVTRTSISWFVDTHVIRTERRPEALSGVRLRPQFRMQQVRGAHMDRSRMQMDWVRYYTLDRRNRRSIDAPPMSQGTFRDAC